MRLYERSVLIIFSCHTCFLFPFEIGFGHAAMVEHSPKILARKKKKSHNFTVFWCVYLSSDFDRLFMVHVVCGSVGPRSWPCIRGTVGWCVCIWAARFGSFVQWYTWFLSLFYLGLGSAFMAQSVDVSVFEPLGFDRLFMVHVVSVSVLSRSWPCIRGTVGWCVCIWAARFGSFVHGTRGFCLCFISVLVLHSWHSRLMCLYLSRSVWIVCSEVHVVSVSAPVWRRFWSCFHSIIGWPVVFGLGVSIVHSTDGGLFSVWTRFWSFMVQLVDVSVFQLGFDPKHTRD